MKNYLILLISIFCITSCGKDEVIRNPKEVSFTHAEKNNNYEFESMGINWLIEFQSYLRDSYEGHEVNSTYKLEEAIYGIEALLNIRYSVKQKGISIYSESQEIKINSTTDPYQLYLAAKNNLIADVEKMGDTDTALVSFDIRLEENQDGEMVITTNSIFKEYNTCIENEYILADPGCNGANIETVFEDDEAYFLGMNGWVDDDPYYPNECDGPNCGDIPACTSVSIFAMEEIEKHVNTNYPDPDCGEGMTWDGTYSDIRDGFEIHDLSSYVINNDCTEPEPLNGSHVTACDCLNSDLLNCMYCNILNSIGFDIGNGSDEYNLPIPEGYHFISMDIGVAYVGPGDFTAHPYIFFEYIYGVPNCTTGVVDPPVVDPVYIDLTPYIIN